MESVMRSAMVMSFVQGLNVFGSQRYLPFLELVRDALDCPVGSGPLVLRLRLVEDPRCEVVHEQKRIAVGPADVNHLPLTQATANSNWWLDREKRNYLNDPRGAVRSVRRKTGKIMASISVHARTQTVPLRTPSSSGVNHPKNVRHTRPMRL